MLLSKRLPILAQLARKAASARRPQHSPRQRHSRRDAALRPSSICCGLSVEILESRQMLSAVATPTFVLTGHAAATIKPAVSAGVAPIDPAQMQAAYSVNAISFNGTPGTGAGQTIAIVDAFNDPSIVSDLTTFNNQWGLQQFNVSGGPTLKVLNQTGGTTLPANATAGGWDVEEALDVEWAHAIAPQANIILFEANSNSFADLQAAVSTAAGSTGVSVVSMSWGGGESSSETSMDSTFLTPNGHQGVTFLASTGDNGSPAGYPAYSPNVVAVGGTTLDINSSGTYIAEGAWSGTGGGISTVESQPSYQVGQVNGTSSTHRTVPDVAMDADPNSGVYVLDSYGGGWFQVGGTSLSTPMWGGLIAIANQGRALAGQSTLNGLTQTLPTLYNLPSSDFNDITSGSNGTYSATVGYDLVTGRGTPIANLLVPALAGYGTTQAPTVSAPSSATLIQNGSLTFSTANGDAISVADASAGTNADSLTLSVAHGTLTLSSTSGLSFTSGANGSASFTVTGTVASLNAALNGLVYQPTSGYTGSDSLAISLTDPGDSLSASTSVSLTVNAPSPPTITAPATGAVNQNGSLTFSTANSNAISIADASAGSSSDSLTISVAHGTLTLASTSGLTVTAGAIGSASMTVTGTVASLNSALNGLTYKPTSGYSGSDSLSISVTDPGDGLSASGSTALTVNAAVAPKITAPATASVRSNGSLVFSNSITITDASAGSSTEHLTLTATHGTLKLGTTTGITFVSGSNRSASMTISGTLARLNAALNGLTFTPTSRFTGSAAITLNYTDVGTNLTASATINITVSRSAFGFIATSGQHVAPSVTHALNPQIVRQTPTNPPVNASPTNSGATFDDNDSTPVDSETQWSAFVGVWDLLFG
jgi:subtilase family serine protease